MKLRRVWIQWSRRPPGEDDAMQVLVGEGLARLNLVAAWIWENLEAAAGRDDLFHRLRRTVRGVEDRRLRSDLDGQLDAWLAAGWIQTEGDLVFPFSEEPWP